MKKKKQRLKESNTKEYSKRYKVGEWVVLSSYRTLDDEPFLAEIIWFEEQKRLEHKRKKVTNYFVKPLNPRSDTETQHKHFVKPEHIERKATNEERDELILKKL